MSEKTTGSSNAISGPTPKSADTTAEPSALVDLLARVEAAEGPDRNLDALTCAHFRVLSPEAETERWAREWAGPVIAKNGRVYLAHDDGSTGLHCAARPVTGSLDAALALVERVLPGWAWALVGPEMDARPFARLFAHNSREEQGECDGNTPALAILAAMLKALIAASPSLPGEQTGGERS